ncbi:MAG: hypothetical protein ACREPA_00555 [Candidatus Dormibacteraceae bacterium]
MTPAEFFQSLTREVPRRLPADLARFQHRRQGRILKIHYGRPEVHFEAWHHLRGGRLEIGLHVEGKPDLNRRGFELLRSRMVEVKSELPAAELEPWDRSWCRLYQTLPAAELDASLAEAAAALLAAYIRSLQPLAEEILASG